MNNSKTLFHGLFVIVTWFMLLFVGIGVISAYFASHGYYSKMLGNSENRRVIISGIISAAIPTLYILLKKNKSILGFGISIFLGQILFGSLFIFIKGALIGGLASVIGYSRNTLIIYLLYLVFFIGILTSGSVIFKLIYKTLPKSIFQLIMCFGMGLIMFLFLSILLILFGLFYAIINWTILISILVFAYYKRSDLKSLSDTLIGIFDNFYIKNFTFSKTKIFSYIGGVLLILSFMYLYFGNLLAYIPYPTAWDANHAYFFIPRVRALNNGFYWMKDMIFDFPSLWNGYIGFFFSLFLPLSNFISPDTVAVSMNFLSGILVLIFGLGLFKEVISYIQSKFSSDDFTNTNSQLIYYLCWLLLLGWLTSGMGAFLVFVDNKTDLGILSLIILAIYSGIYFIRQFESNSNDINTDKILGVNKYIASSAVLSGLFFAGACLAKPTALLDVVNFSLLLIGIRFGALGTIGGGLSVIGLLAIKSFKDTGVYISSEVGYVFLLIGLLLLIFSIFYSFKKNVEKIKLLFIWGLSFLILLISYKLPITILINHIQENNVSLGRLVESVILGQNSNKNDTIKIKNKLLTSTNIPPSSIDETNYEPSTLVKDGPLYENLKKAGGDNYKEDVGRYVGYGRRSFNNPYWGIFFQPFAGSCLGLNSVAVKLCNNQTKIDNIKLTDLKALLSELNNSSKGYILLNNFVKAFEKEDLSTEETIKKAVGDNYEIVTALKDYINDNSIRIQKVCFVAVGSAKVDKLKDQCLVQEDQSIIGRDVVNHLLIEIPYNYLKVFNITFNWSLQNESSYYTDIGYIWLFAYFFIIVGFLYGLGINNRLLLSFNGVSVLGWVIWNLIGGGILWYGIGLIIWSIIGVSIFFYTLLFNLNNGKFKTPFLFAFYLFVGIIFYQVLLNFVRISTQGGEGPFLHYKAGVGKEQYISPTLSNEPKIKYGYSSEDIFNLQFAHYKDFIKLSNNRKPGEKIFLAGTYARYFLTNQKDIIYDQMLNWLWEMFSDFDVNKSYARLVDKNIKYLVIDPNIGTVVMGGGNMSLFERFFAKINQLTGKFEQDGVMTMISRLVAENKITLISTNNISIKYAYILSNDEILGILGSGATLDDAAMLRSKLATIRFWPNKNDLYDLNLQIAKQRILSLDFIQDLADGFGKQINSDKLKSIIIGINKIQSLQKGLETYKGEIEKLTEDEKYTLMHYLNIYLMMATKSKDLDSVILNFIQSTSVASSQIIVLKVN